MDRFLIRLKGSYTVEMAMISGVWMLVIFASLLLIIGTYKRAYDTAVCCEAIIQGSTEAVKRTGDGRIQTQKRLAAERTKYTVSGSKREITVTFADKVEIPFANLRWKWEKVIKGKVIRPVLFIERVKKAEKFRDAIVK